MQLKRKSKLVRKTDEMIRNDFQRSGHAILFHRSQALALNFQQSFQRVRHFTARADTESARSRLNERIGRHVDPMRRWLRQHFRRRRFTELGTGVHGRRRRSRHRSARLRRFDRSALLRRRRTREARRRSELETGEILAARPSAWRCRNAAIGLSFVDAETSCQRYEAVVPDNDCFLAGGVDDGF